METSTQGLPRESPGKARPSVKASPFFPLGFRLKPDAICVVSCGGMAVTSPARLAEHERKAMSTKGDRPRWGKRVHGNGNLLFYPISCPFEAAAVDRFAWIPKPKEEAKRLRAFTSAPTTVATRLVYLASMRSKNIQHRRVHARKRAGISASHAIRSINIGLEVGDN